MNRKVRVCLAAVGLWATVAAAQAAFPATPAGRMLEAWLRNFNQGNEETSRKFAADHLAASALARMPAERAAAMDAQLRQRWGRIEPVQVESQSDTEAAAILQDQDATKWMRVTVRLEAEAPHKIREMNVDRVPRPASVPAPARVSDQELARQLDKLLGDRTAQDRFSGTVLIARDGKPVYTKAFGLADREVKTPNKTDTKFALGSMNKMVTSVAIAQLAQAGKLKYTDTVAQLLPDYPNKEAAAKITVHQLLTHTSGLGDVFGPEFQQKKDGIRTVREWFPLFVDKPLRFEPGKDWSYSNAGFMVLGAIIENLSGQDYYTYVREHIYKPAGMADSDSYAKFDKVANMAEGYTSAGAPGGQRRNNVDTRPYRGFPAGGGYSTVYDLLKFAEALRRHKLLNAHYTDLVIGGKVEPQPGGMRRYAYGFDDNRSGGVRTVGHGGGAPGMNADLSIYWDAGITVAVLANLDPPAAGDIAEFIRDRIQLAAGR